MFSSEMALCDININKFNVLDTKRFRDEKLINRFSEMSGVPTAMLADSVDDTSDFNLIIKLVVLAKEIQEFNNSKHDDELELMGKFSEFNAYVSQSLLAFVLHKSLDPLGRHGDKESADLAFNVLSDLAYFDEVEPWAIMSLIQVYKALSSLAVSLYQCELNEVNGFGIKADTVQQVYDSLEDDLNGNEEMKLLLTNSFCFVATVLLKLIRLGMEKPVHEKINASFVVEGDDYITIFEGFKKKYGLYIGSYTKLLQSVDGNVSETTLTDADWNKGLLGFQFENELLVVQNPLDREANILFPLAKKFKEYTQSSGVKIELNTFSIF